MVQHELGDLTEHIWQQYLAIPDDYLPHPDLPALVREIAIRPELRQLVVYTSHLLLCLTKEHFQGGEVAVCAELMGAGQYKVFGTVTAAKGSKLLGEGDVAFCAARMVEALAPTP